MEISFIVGDTQIVADVFSVLKQNQAGIQTVLKCAGRFYRLSEVVPPRI